MLRRVSWFWRLALLAHLTGLLMVILAVAMVPPTLLAFHDGTPDLPGLQAALWVSLIGGVLLGVPTRRWAKRVEVGHREGFLIVGIGWLMAGLVGALPFWFYALMSPEDPCGAAELLALSRGGQPPMGADFCTYTNSAFEAISGFTTTGATIITDGLWGDEHGLTLDGRAGLPRGIMLWRLLTHYLGGMGIIVLGVAVLPLLGVGGMQLFKAEVSGPTTDKLAPRVGETARLLWQVYLLLTAILFVMLTAGGLTAFEAIAHAMSTMATGGFSTRALSVAAFGSAYVEWVIVVFMFIAGINFTLLFAVMRGKSVRLLRDPEWRVYSLIFVAATLAVAWSLYSAPAGISAPDALRQAAFQVLSIQTTTGFASADYEQWTFAPVALYVLIALMFCGAMAGSTSGGVKVIRHLLMVKIWLRELFLLSHPRAVRPIRLAGRGIPPEVTRAVSAFIGVYLALMTLGVLLFLFEGQDLMTAFTSSAALLGNVGPGLGEVGPMDSYDGLGFAAKWVGSLFMLLGRLEIYTVLVLLTPAFWRR